MIRSEVRILKAVNNERTLAQAPGLVQHILRRYYSYLQHRPGPRGTLAESTINNNLVVISSFFRQHSSFEEFTADIILANIVQKKSRDSILIIFKRFAKFLHKYYPEQLPKDQLEEILALKIKPIKNKQTAPEKLYKWSIPFSRWNEVYDRLRSKPFKFAAYLMLTFGLRVGEVVYLQWNNVILKSPDPHLRIKGNSNDNWEPKTPSSNRVLPISDKQLPVFLRYKTYYEDFFGKRSGYVILSELTKKKMSTQWLWNVLTSKVKLEFTEEGKTFLRPVRPHVLRYSCAMYLWEKTHDILAISKFLGHTSISITEQYLALSPQQVYDNLKVMLKKADF